MVNSQLLDIYRCSNQMEGEIVRAQIAASGIPAFVQGDDVYWFSVSCENEVCV